MRNRQFQAAATVAFTKAVRDGNLVRPERCDSCGLVCTVDGHHEDYAKPFEVRWLCRSCHHGQHRAEIAASTASRPRCSECGLLIYRHLIRNGQVAYHGSATLHKHCARKYKARIATTVAA